MKIALISPRHKQGLTTTAILLGQALAHTTPFEVVLTQVGDDSSMPEYLGINDIEEDKTRTTSQMLKLLETNNLSHSDLKDYMIKVGPRLRYLNISSASSKPEESDRLTRHLLGMEEHGQIQILDVNTELYDDITQEIFAQSDVVFIVAEQTRLSAKMVENIRASELFPDPDKVCYLFNLFDSRVMSGRETSKLFGIRHRRTVALSYNPYIKKFGNQKKLDTIIGAIKNNDERVLNLNKDLLSMARLIGHHIGFKAEWRV